jgi:UDP-N-acetyl-2-amino-2-deoxyglucuronate dehydrogenase
MNKIRFAIIGCGQIGKRHAAIIANHPQAELAALVDIKPRSVLNIHQYNASFLPSLNAFLESGIEADVINIATPNGLHAEHAIACLNAGKNVVVEKPMALHVKNAEQIIAAADKNKKHVFVVMQNRYSPPIAWLKKIIDEAILGKIYSVQLNCFWNRDERYYKDNWHGTKEMDGGVLFTQFSHFIDIFYWIFGDIKNIDARLRSFNHQHLTVFEDSGIVMFDFGDNSIGCLNFSTSVWEKNFESSITIIAENGTVKIGGQYMDKLEYCHIKNYALPSLQTSNIENDYGGYKGSAANHHYVIQNVIDVLQRKATINATVAEGLKVVDIIERIYKAANNF